MGSDAGTMRPGPAYTQGPGQKPGARLSDRRFNDAVGVLHGLAALDLVDVLHAFNDLAPDRVLLVEEARVIEADEELTVGTVGRLRAGHRGGAAHVRLIVELRRK